MAVLSYLLQFYPEDLTPGEKDAHFRSAVRVGLGQQIPLTQTYIKQELRGMGYSFGNNYFSQLWNEVKETQQNFYYFGKLGNDENPDPSQFHGAGYLTKRYKYVGEYLGQTDETGYRPIITTAIEVNDLLTPEQARELLIEQLIEKYKIPRDVAESLVPIGALIRI